MCECCGGDCKLTIEKDPYKTLRQKMLLEAYEELSKTFDEYSENLKKDIPYEMWPKRLQVAGIKEKLLGEQQEVYNNIWDVLKARGFNPLEALPMAVIARLEDIGRAQAKLHMILESEILEDLSKHNNFWLDAEIDTEEKLQDIRMKLSCLSDNLWDLWAILRKEEEI